MDKAYQNHYNIADWVKTMECAKAKDEDCEMPKTIDRPAGYSAPCPGADDIDVMDYLGLKRPSNIQKAINDIS